MGWPIYWTLVPSTRQRVERMCLPHTLDKLSSEGAAPSEWSRTYLLCKTRPDIKFVVGQLSRPNSDPRIGYMCAARRVVRYLKGPIDPEDRKSVLGCCCFIGVALGSWSNKKQRTLSASTNNAECIALGRASMCVDTSLLKRDGLGRGRRDYVKR